MWGCCMEITKNIEPLTCNQYADRLLRLYGIGDYKNHISLYILPSGDIIDCKYPKNVKHIGFTDMIYGNFASIREQECFADLKVNSSALVKYNCRDFSLPVVQEALIRNTGVCAKNPAHKKAVDELKVYLSDDDLLVHDMGYVKFLIMGRDSLFLTLPNQSINGKHVKGAQLDTVKSIASMCSINNYEDIIENSKRNNNALSIMLNRTVKGPNKDNDEPGLTR